MVIKVMKSSGGDKKSKKDVIDNNIKELEKLFFLLPNDSGDLILKWANKISDLKSEYISNPKQPANHRNPRHDPHPRRSRSRSPQTRRYGSQVYRNRDFSSKSDSTNTKCYWCHKEGHWTNSCPKLAEEKCYRCKKYGHIATHCKNRFYKKC